MHILRKFSKFIVVGLLLIVTPLVTAVEIQKSPHDKREYQYLSLDNGLQAVLVSDPDAEHAAVALNVQVGQYHDPADREGLAHFLEHMLFLGTAKYPDPGEYREYITSHGGQDNAWTSSMNTQYFFTILPEYLPNGLDRFAQFFISPNFDESLVDRERHAVNSEYLLKIKDDGRRAYMVNKVTANPRHPMTQFGVGSLETLADENHNKKVRDDLIEFYNNNYSSDRMILAIVAPQSLEELSSMVAQDFNAVPNRALLSNKFPILAFNYEQTGKEILVQSLGDYQSLDLMFPIPPQAPNFDKGSINYILHLLTRSGPGSLEQMLKEKNWIISMSSSNYDLTYAQDLVDIDFSLTDEGMENIDKIVEYFFSYVDYLQKLGPQQEIFEDLKIAGERDFLYAERQDPQALAAVLPSLVEHYPIELILKAEDLSKDTKFDPEHIANLLHNFTPKNLRMMLVNNKVKGTTVEPYYQVNYAVQDFNQGQIELWTKEDKGITFTAPTPNKYLPKDFSIEKVSQNTTSEQYPQRVLENPGLTLWYKQDDIFKLPKNNILLLLSVPDVQSTPRRALLQSLMLMGIRDSLADVDQEFQMAGVWKSVYGDQNGIIVDVSMFSDKQTQVVDAIIEHVVGYKVSPQRFNSYKDELKRNLDNFTQKALFQQAMAIMQALTKNPAWLPEQLLPELAAITQSDVDAYVQEFLQQVQLESLMHGNLSQSSAISTANTVASKLKVNTVPRKNIPLPELIKLTSGNSFTYTFDPKHEDATIINYYQAPSTGDSFVAQTALLSQIINVPIFEQLRTKEQLGYVVGVTVLRLRDQSGCLFYIESPTKAPVFLRERLISFLKDFDQNLPSMPEKDFANFKESLKHNLLRKPSSLSEETTRYWDQIINGTYRFDFLDKIAAQVDPIQLTDFATFYQDMWMNPSARKMISVVSKSTEDYVDGSAIKSIADFKTTEVYH